jgi:hypothetical protein
MVVSGTSEAIKLLEDRFGNAFCSDPNVTDICKAAQVIMDKPKPKPKPKKKIDEEG